LGEATVREIYETVGREAMTTGASDDDRMAEVRKQLLAAVGERLRHSVAKRTPLASHTLRKLTLSR
jgi:hypothetical protein